MNKRIGLAAALILALSATASAQVKDYFLFEWDAPIEEVHRTLSFYGYQIEERGPNYLTYRSTSTRGYPYWETYFFSEGLNAVWKESPTEWHEFDGIDLIYEFYLPQHMSSILYMSNDGFTETARGDTYRVWKGERNIAGAFYLADNRGYYRVFSFVARATALDIVPVVVQMLMLGIEMDLGSALPEPEGETNRP